LENLLEFAEFSSHVASVVAQDVRTEVMARHSIPSEGGVKAVTIDLEAGLRLGEISKDLNCVASAAQALAGRKRFNLSLRLACPGPLRVNLRLFHGFGNFSRYLL